MTTEPSIEMYEAALRPRHPSRLWVVVIALFVCSAFAFMCACAVAIAHEASQAYAAKACAQSGGTWTGVGCEVPSVNITVTPRSASAPDRGPLLGPGGA